MTQAIVRLKQPDTRNRWIDESPINQWLNENFGPGESRRKAKYKTASWYVEHNQGYLEYYFARKQDAVLFALKWS